MAVFPFDGCMVSEGSIDSLDRTLECEVVRAIQAAERAEWRGHYTQLRAEWWGKYNRLRAEWLGQHNRLRAEWWGKYNQLKAEWWGQYNRLKAEWWGQYNRLRAEWWGQYNRLSPCGPGITFPFSIRHLRSDQACMLQPFNAPGCTALHCSLHSPPLNEDCYTQRSAKTEEFWINSKCLVACVPITCLSVIIVYIGGLGGLSRPLALICFLLYLTDRL